MRNASPYVALNPQLQVDYSVYVSIGDDSPCELKKFAEDLCKGFSSYYIRPAPKMSENLKAYLVECYVALQLGTHLGASKLWFISYFTSGVAMVCFICLTIHTYKVQHPEPTPKCICVTQ